MLGHVILWAFSLAAAILLVATLLAFSTRWPRWLGEIFWPLLAASLLFALSLGATVLTGYLEFYLGMEVSRFYAVLAWTVLYLIAACAVLVGGLRSPHGTPEAREWRRGRLALGFVVAAGLTALTFAYLDWSIRDRLAAARSETGPLAAISGPIGSRDNAAPHYREAFVALRKTERDPRAQWEIIWARGDVQPGDIDPANSALVAFIGTQQEGLKLLRGAAARPKCWLDRDLLKGLELDHSELREFLHGARILALDSVVSAGRGNVSQALDDVLAIFAMAGHIDEPTVPAQFYAARIEEIGAWTLEDVLRLASPKAADLDRRPLPAPPDYPGKMVRAFEGDEVSFGLTCFSSLANGSSPEWDRRFDLRAGNAEIRPLLTTPLYRVFYLPCDLDAYRRSHAEMRALAARPVYETDSDWRAFEREWSTPRRGAVAALIRPDGRTCAFRAAEALAAAQLARLAVELCRFRCHEGRYPDSLDRLVPAYLPQIPVDPFDGLPMRARPAGEGVIVYSIGPDLRDDGGIPWDHGLRSGDLIFRLY